MSEPADGKPQMLLRSVRSSRIKVITEMTSHFATEPEESFPNDFRDTPRSYQVLPGGVSMPLPREEIGDSITVALDNPMAPSPKRCSVASQQQEGEEEATYDLFNLSGPIQPTKNAAVDDKDQVYDLFKQNPAGSQNHSQHRASVNQPAQPKEGKQKKKKSNPLGPRDNLGVAKAARRPKQASRQPKHSKMPSGSCANNPIAIDDKPAFCGGTAPCNTSDPTPYYIAAEAPALPSALQEEIPPFDPVSINTCPKPPPPVILLDPKARIRYQVHMSRYLAYSGVVGPYEVGDYLCDVQMSNGKLVRIAKSNTGPNGGKFWSHLMTGERVQAQHGSRLTGKPVSLMNGALAWMEDEQGQRIPPEWTFNEPRPSHL
ncbi:hypothetical protein F53441_13901 [Fusarium austroafricanum]|uniref:Uncharacterized protein n=1 Tax=Fusarium austroafricanum TaxID=2364996 RepID=A0A8H4JLT7_9HYPO|nr:hypothetical protein F53441_13901 [Fusarium austroafricanum]